MINFRFHIVSLTAVFLAFAVGLVLGTAFLDDATERQLNRQLDRLEDDLSSARRNTTELETQLDRFEEVDEDLDQQLGDRLLPGTLAGEPVLVIAPEGLEGEPVERVVEALAQADAAHVGTWRLTDRLTLDDDGEAEDLATALEITTEDDVDRLRRSLTSRLATALFLAIHASDTDQDGSGLVGAPTESAEPTFVGGLHEQGFIDYELPEGSESDVVLLPSSGLRVVIVTGTGAVVPHDDVLQPTLSDLVSDGEAPVVVVASTPADDDPNNVDGIDSLVARVRDEDELSQRISTVDDLELASGRLAMMLALQQSEPTDPQIGHYGLGPGAQELMPPVPEDDGS